MKYEIIQGDNRQTLKTLPDNSIDAIVTDPPYGIDFLGKAWDANTGALETYQECLRVLKPGGHILAFSAARTYHHLAITLEQAGFEIRDQIMWIYSSGFPKSQDVGRSIQRSLGVKQKKTIPKEKQTSTAGFANNGAQEKDAWSGETTICTDPEAKQWEGWGTALKPAHEPIALARKPLKGSIAKNAQKWGTGALNIDACRVPYENIKDMESAKFGRPSDDNYQYMNTEAQKTRDNLNVVEGNDKGRFPSNVLGEIPDYQKYFYCPKVSRRERHMGFELPPAMFGGVQGCYDENGERFAVGFDARAEGKTKKKKHDPLAHIPTNPDGMWDNGVQFQEKKQNVGNVGNNHPTVKPVALMEYLIKLITPPGGTVLDPFNGSGSTGMAAVGMGFNYIGCELDPHYVEISLRRIAAWLKAQNPITSSGLFDECP